MTASRLLLVDDDPATAAVIARVAQQCGYAVRATVRADEFESAYRDFQPTLITIDLAMPEIDGVELLRFLADAGCTAPILIVSGFDRYLIEASRRLGAAYGLTMGLPVAKPFRAAELKTLFERYSQIA